MKNMVEDEAPGHKKYAIQYRDLNGLDNLQWPAQSPGLNLTQALWAIWKRSWGKHAEEREV